MRKPILAVIILVFIGLNSLAQSVDVYNYRGVSAVLRHASEVHFRSDQKVEFALNVLLEVDNDSCMIRVLDMVPKADMAKVISFQYKIMDPSGKVLLKQKVRKSMYESVADFMPVNSTTDYFRRNDVLMVELDFRLLLTNLQAAYVWPIIDGVPIAQDISLRLIWDNITLFTKNSNVDDYVERGFYDGREFLLWQIKKLTPSGGEFSSGFAKNPRIELFQVSDTIPE